MQLLSTSTTNITLWAVDEHENIWVPRHRLGETGGTDEAGYFDGQFSPDGSFILFHNYIGAFDLWQLSPDKEVKIFTLPFTLIPLLNPKV